MLSFHNIKIPINKGMGKGNRSIEGSKIETPPHPLKARKLGTGNLKKRYMIL